MTKGELIELLKDYPDDYKIDIVDKNLINLPMKYQINCRKTTDKYEDIMTTILEVYPPIIKDLNYIRFIVGNEKTHNYFKNEFNERIGNDSDCMGTK